MGAFVDEWSSASTTAGAPSGLARRIGEPGEEAITREDDVARLRDLAEGGHNATLFAPRRFGKTTLLKQLLHDAEKADMLAVLVDFSDALSEADVAARLEHSYRALHGRSRA